MAYLGAGKWSLGHPPSMMHKGGSVVQWQVTVSALTAESRIQSRPVPGRQKAVLRLLMVSQFLVSHSRAVKQFLISS